MKKIAWTVYGLLIAVFTLFGVYLSVVSQSVSAATIINMVFVTFYLTGLYGYVSQTALWEPSRWRILFWVNVVAISVYSLMMIYLYALAGMIDVVIVVVSAIPMAYALYQYSSPSFPAWEKVRYSHEQEMLSSLLENSSELTASVISKTPQGQQKTTVTIKSREHDVTVDVVKELGGEQESLNQVFSDLKDVARFLEESTPARVGDFA